MSNQGAAGPIRHRLSELPERASLPAAELLATPAESGRAEAGPEVGLEQRAAALLGSLPRPAELSPAAMVRIRERLGTLGEPSGSRPWWQWAAASTVALGAATMAAILLPRLGGTGPANELAVRELRLPDSGVARLHTRPGSELMLGGPGALVVPATPTQPPQLLDGRLAVRAGGEDVVVAAAGRRITIPKGHVAEVVVHLSELVRVAAYIGDTRLLNRGQALIVHEGTTWTSAGERPLAVECRGLVTAALAGGAWPSAGPCGDGVSATAAAAVVVSALPAEREPAPAEPPTGLLHPVVRPAARAPKVSTVLVTTAAPVVAKTAGPATAASHGPSGLAEESRLLGVALHQLHQERDGGAALRSLDSYQQRFPKGLLTEEAQAARIDALLMLDHRSEALALLEQTQFQRLGRGGELRVVRAELRSSAGRCREALADFAAVLTSTAAPAPPPVAERALYGQASCYTQLADASRARAALEQYLTRFPTGRFAEAARRSLQALP